jgi:hypothetical protein
MAKDLTALKGDDYVTEANPKLRVPVKLFKTFKFVDKTPDPRAFSILYLMMSAIDWSQFKTPAPGMFFERQFTIPMALIARHLNEPSLARIKAILDDMNACEVSWFFGALKGFPAETRQPMMINFIDGKDVVFQPGQMFLITMAFARHWTTVEFNAARSFRSVMSHLVYNKLVLTASYDHTDTLFIPAEELREYGYNGPTYRSTVELRFVSQVVRDFERGQVRSFTLEDAYATEKGVYFIVSRYQKEIFEHRGYNATRSEKEMLESVAFEQRPSINLVTKSVQMSNKKTYEVVEKWKSFCLKSADAAKDIARLGIDFVFAKWAKTMQSFDDIKYVDGRFIVLSQCLENGEDFAIRYGLKPSKNEELMQVYSAVKDVANIEEFISKFERLAVEADPRMLRALTARLILASEAKSNDQMASAWEYAKKIFDGLKPPAVVV